MRCSRCSRPMKSPAVVSGGLALGPTCARLVGITITKGRRELAPVVQPGQLKLFDEVTS